MLFRDEGAFGALVQPPYAFVAVDSYDQAVSLECRLLQILDMARVQNVEAPIGKYNLLPETSSRRDLRFEILDRGQLGVRAPLVGRDVRQHFIPSDGDNADA